MGQRNVGREIAWSLGLGALFALGLYLYIRDSIPEPTPPTLIAPSQSTAADTRSTAAHALAERWGAALANANWTSAHASLARTVRERISAEALQQLVKTHPQLAGCSGITLLRTREQRAGNDPSAYSLSGTGLLKSSGGNVEIVLHFVEEPDGLRIANAVVAGSPVL